MPGLNSLGHLAYEEPELVWDEAELPKEMPIPTQIKMFLYDRGDYGFLDNLLNPLTIAHQSYITLSKVIEPSFLIIPRCNSPTGNDTT